MATTDNVLSDLIINDLTQEEYDNLVAAGEVQEEQIYVTNGAGSSGGGSTTGGLEYVSHDSSLDGAGTPANPLKVASTVIAQINDKADGTVVETLSSVVSENTTKLNTLRNDTDSLGDQVSGIEEKIPSSASATNQLATKEDLPIGFDATVVDQLPATGEKGIIYLVPKDGAAPDIHDEYIWIDSEQKFEFIGSTAVDLTGYVKNTDYAKSGKGGVVRVSPGNGINCTNAGFLFAVYATNSEIVAKYSIYKPIVPASLDYAVKTSVTTNTIELTDEEKTAAQDWLGIKQGASLPILMAIWSDHVINDMSWLRADTFSWQSGDVYKAVYEHLANEYQATPPEYYAWHWHEFSITVYTKSHAPKVGDIVYYTEDYMNFSERSTVVKVEGEYIYIEFDDSRAYRLPGDDVGGTRLQTDTIDDIEIQYYTAEDGHKICLPDQESNITALYEKAGAADYYLLDTTNKQFKLPRKQKRTLIQAVKNDDGTWYNLYSDGWIEQGGTASSGSSSVVFPVEFADTGYYFNANLDDGGQGTTLHAISSDYTTTGCTVKEGQSGVGQRALTANAKWVASGYAAESVYASAGMRLEYYYVGNFEQSAIEQTAGITAETLNGKVDVDLNNINPSNSAKATIVGWGMPDYSAGVVVADGYQTTFPCFVSVQQSTTATSNSAAVLNVDGVIVDLQVAGGGYSKRLAASCYVDAGHTITIDGSDGSPVITVYPLKGLNND